MERLQIQVIALMVIIGLGGTKEVRLVVEWPDQPPLSWSTSPSVDVVSGGNIKVVREKQSGMAGKKTSTESEGRRGEAAIFRS